MRGLPRNQPTADGVAAVVEHRAAEHLLLHLHSNTDQELDSEAGELVDSPAFLCGVTPHGARATGTMMGVTEPVPVAMRSASHPSSGAGLQRHKKRLNEE